MRLADAFTKTGFNFRAYMYIWIQVPDKWIKYDILSVHCLIIKPVTLLLLVQLSTVVIFNS